MLRGSVCLPVCACIHRVDCPTALPDEAVLLTEVVAAQLAAVGIKLDVTHHVDRVAYANMVRLSEVAIPLKQH